MNVLHVITALHKGGAEAHLLLLTKELQAQGAHCEVAYLRQHVGGGSIDLRSTFEAAGIRTHYLGCERSFDPRSGVRLHQLLNSGKWDVVHSHLPRADAAAAGAKALNARRTWISTIHDPYDGAYSGARFIPVVAPMWRLADGVIAVSEPVRQWAIARLGISPDVATTIVHGIELDRTAAAEVHPQPAGFCIGSIGRYEPRKGHETLIRAMVPIVREFPQARLKIAGHDPHDYSAVLRGLVRQLGLEQHVELIGFMSDKEAFFADVDIFAFASQWEGFGIVVLEAMDAGKPVVVSDISPLRDIIVPGVSGLVAQPGQADAFARAIAALLRDRASLRRIGEAGRQRVAAEFSQSRMVEKTLAYYHQVARRPAARVTRRAAAPGANYDARVVEAFGKEWQRFDQQGIDANEGLELFNRYFRVFPWSALPPNASGFDAGCGSGRWARFVAPRVGTLHCVDASLEALRVAQRNLAGFSNCRFHHATVDSMPLPDGESDFGYALGVLHHIPDTASALRTCVRKLKPGAPLLVYLYYSFENRPKWFPKVWKASDMVRSVLSRSPFAVRTTVSNALALSIYWPLARTAKLAERMGVAVDHIPLSAYRDVSFYVMRTDALDRFGTRLEKRFTRQEIRDMMEEAGLGDIHFHSGAPYWVAVGRRVAPAVERDREGAQARLMSATR
jgi:glycosyltransferase involved in cell wall biosynthesis/SAM-dependent methyltransferase